MEQHDDLYYIEKVKSGLTNHFSYIVENYKDVVFSIALKVLKNRDEAEEMAQEVFIKVYHSLDKFRGSSKFSTWLYSVTYNHCISQVRKKKYDIRSLENVQIADEDDDFNFDGFSEEERREILESALKKLPEDDYTLVILYYYEDQTIEELARVAKLSVSNTKVKLFRARKKLHIILNEMLKEEIDSLL
ncbi:MAG: sigma-70 family RNA polymerase sigma factor [Prolixibacteraceae bacterium]|nr:sigma-70 family RNA polymerase sigma factor [Prolixibacteraceae bacterium]MBN2773420.1 sigma-70 family RNA polymerase sigma factor [Prolixibacteraceae bacterium]